MDEIDLRFVVTHLRKLSFSQHTHGFHPGDGILSTGKGLKAPHGLERLLESGMVGFNRVVEKGLSQIEPEFAKVDLKPIYR